MSRPDHVVDGITQMILDGELTPGDRLPVEKELAARLDVSRGSLREGVRALSVLGVVESRQGDGTYVTTLDPSLLVAPLGLVIELQSAGHALPVHAVRRVLETEAAGLAASNAGESQSALGRASAALEDAADVLAGSPGGASADVDHERLLQADIAFHRAIADAAGNPVLAALIEALAGRTARHRLWRGIADAGADQRTQHEHEAVLAAVTDGDPERAKVRMATHLLEVEDFLRARSEPTG
ncbi:FadR/GntR family transcriptional regulator [Demequina lutea]|uniref:DNA-binding FadR family transcriptional regulator n=1 Tax=Demequina lutea TaxID=431489 RepID=A0A7Y9ZET5_9MICO|nr:FadR/GntR family transcriptional regulator [Demequina lutea]NYI42655.1 DNA-binding FadR family transcriptional regulator [Demequina lutea]